MLNNHIVLLIILSLFIYVSHCGHVYTEEELNSFRNKKCTNLLEVQTLINFENIHVDPYPKLWYDTNFDEDKSCYVIFPNETDKSTYELKTFTKEEAELYAPGRNYWTHKRQCGVCSTLDDLVVYAGTPDLTNPVRRCALLFIPSLITSCLRKIGFTEECSMIWYWNTHNTKKLARHGGCFGVCMANVFTPNNVPEGHYNPCKPLANVYSDASMPFTPTEGGDLELAEDHVTREASLLNSYTPEIASKSDLNLPMFWSSGACKNCCTPSIQKRTKHDGLCGNTINGKPACDPSQYTNNPYRMNPCLQCDECRSGPIFQKVAGRTRRHSGIVSAIERPGVVEYIHSYE